MYLNSQIHPSNFKIRKS